MLSLLKNFIFAVFKKPKVGKPVVYFRAGEPIKEGELLWLHRGRVWRWPSPDRQSRKIGTARWSTYIAPTQDRESEIIVCVELL